MATFILAGIPSAAAAPACARPRQRSSVLPVRAASSESVQKMAATTKRVELGKGTGLMVSPIGVGAWSWGDQFYWNTFSWSNDANSAAQEAFNATLDAGVNLIDTAEVYNGSTLGGASSESLLGTYLKDRSNTPSGLPDDLVVATKFAPLPWRFTSDSVVSALKASLERLGREKVELYQIHWPNLLGDDAFLEGLAQCYEQGLTEAVGVSNFSEIRLRNAVRKLDRRGVKLASNQVNYSLVYREPETNGVLNACEELGVGLIAYSPLAQGALTGKYSAENPPPGPRRGFYNSSLMESFAPLLSGMKAVAEERGTSVAQVALAFLTANPIVVPIPGVKNVRQVVEAVGAMSWEMSTAEVDELRALAKKANPVQGFPVEKF